MTRGQECLGSLHAPGGGGLTGLVANHTMVFKQTQRVPIGYDNH